MDEIKENENELEIIEIELIQYRKCSTCNEYKLETKEYFASNKAGKDGLNSTCKSCKSTYSKNYSNTFDGFFKKLSDGCKGHARARLNKTDNLNRVQRGICTINEEFLKNLYKSQKGLCYYSNIPMNTQSYIEWKCSVERINNNKGYISDNIVLCCYEFNIAKQWTKEKFQQIIGLIKKEIPKNELEKTKNDILKISSNKGIPHKVNQLKFINNKEYTKCNVCNKFKLRNKFGKSLSVGCTECSKNRKKIYYNSPRGFFTLLLSSTKKSSIDRSKRKNRNKNVNNDFKITLNNIVDIYVKQNGRCFYSGIPLVLLMNNDWKASIERKDVMKGYTVDNVCLVCQEFNGSDLTSCRKKYDDSEDTENKYTSGSWNKKKFEYFMKCFTSK